MTRNEGEQLRSEERTAVFLALAAVEIQKIQGSSPVYSRRLFKVLANCIWDWSQLTEVSDNRICVGSIGDFVWVPYRFGSLGRIMPSIRYSGVEFTDGLFVHPADLFQCPQYAKYGIRVVRGQNGKPALDCPSFVTFQDQTHSGALPVDLNFWREATGFYAGLNDEYLDALASCRTDTATSLNLWTQIVFWREDACAVARNLQDLADRSREVRETRMQREASNASAAANQFSIKIEYWRKRDRIISEARTMASKIEIGEFIPVVKSRADCPFCQKLDALVTFEQYLRAANLIVRGLFARVAIHERAVELCEIEGAVDIISSFLSQPVSFHELATLWYRGNVKDIGHYVDDLVNRVTDQAEVALGLRIADRRAHFQEFVQSHYPLPRFAQ